MRKLNLLAVCCLALFLLGCGGGPKDMIVGKWEATEPAEAKAMGATMEFTKDGKVKASMSLLGQKVEMDGTYKWVDDNNIEVTLKGPDGKEKIEKNKVTVTKDSLTLVGKDASGKEETMKLKKL